ncbi:MAG: hypothetical protein ABIU05_17370 [Nitrospirales bacterium]
MMERVTKLKEKGDELATKNGREVTIRSLPASAQFSTRSCSRCEGLLVSEWTYDLQEIGNHNVEGFRCVQCGNRIDPVIVQNQVRLSGARQSQQQVRHTRIAPWGNVA